jgi:uncharacterized membrane protein YobD (UPF0266 family)
VKRLFLSCVLSGLGAGVGCYVFFLRTPWLIQKQGGFYVQDSAPYAATGAIGGLLSAEGLIALASLKERSRASKKLKSALSNEALLQGLSLDQQAVLFEAIRRMEKGRDE